MQTPKIRSIAYPTQRQYLLNLLCEGSSCESFSCSECAYHYHGDDGLSLKHIQELFLDKIGEIGELDE